jgi:hypothetical protein
MKIFLSRWTDSGALSIASTDDGRYHLLWRGVSLIDESSVQAVMRKASEGPLHWPPDGTPIRPFGLLRRWGDWRVASAPLAGPVETGAAESELAPDADADAGDQGRGRGAEREARSGRRRARRSAARRQGRPSVARSAMDKVRA